MKFNKKLLAVLSALLLLLLIFSSCSSNEYTSEDPADSLYSEPTDEVTDAPQEDIPPLDPENIQIFASNTEGKKVVNFAIVRPRAESSSSVVSQAAMDILKSISNLLGTAPRLKNDVGKKGSSPDPNTYEILIGYTSYPQSEEVAQNCGYGDYVIDVVGNKIVIMAYNDIGIMTAANAFVDEINENYNDMTGIITLKESEFAADETLNEQLSAIPIFEGGDFYSYYDAGTRNGEAETQCDEIIIKSTTPQLYEAYLEKVEDAGFTKYTEHDMGESKFATYVGEEHMLNIGFYDFYDEVRVIIEDADAPRPALESENTYTKVTDSQITMLGLEYYKTSDESYASNGLSILIRLEDGRFIVVDGGFNRKACANMLLDTIKDQSKEYTDSPTIAAWIVTHPHGDHNGMINSHFEKFKDIKIESFLVNFISENERAKAIATYPTNWSSNEGGNFGKTYDVANTFGSTLYKIHVGQVFHIADLKMEVLYTIESFGPKVCNALNTTSTIIKMTFNNGGNETTYLCTGDATGHAMEISANMYGNYMQCDIVQTCHHGYSTWGNNSGMIHGYTKTSANLVLWPQGLNAFNNYVDKDYNNILFKLPNFKECYVAGGQGDLVIVKLPYVYKNSLIEVICTADCPYPHHHTNIAS